MTWDSVCPILGSMGQELAIQSDRTHDGKYMARLSNEHREFVLKLVELGPSKKAAAKAAEAVGFTNWNGYKLIRDQRILDAIHEEAGKQLVSGALIGVRRLIEIAQDKKHKDSYKASKDLAAINGFNPEQRIVVEHVTQDSKEIVKELRAMGKELDVDVSGVIKAFGIVEGEFTEVTDET